MNNTKTLVLKSTGILFFLILLGVATIAPLFGNQFITGSIVNCCLIVAVRTLGIRAALLIGIIPSTVALAAGLLPSVLAPMIPFIILGNALLVLVIDYLKKYNYWLGIISGALLKFGLLAGSVSIVIGLLSNKNIAQNVAYMMNWPQLVTAVAGGILAFGIIYLKNRAVTRK